MDRDGSTVRIEPADLMKGELKVPGDKSISHRFLLIPGLATGRSRVKNLSGGEDLRRTMECLRAVGVDIKRKDGELLVKGRGIGGLKEPEEELDVGNSGTLTRLFAGVLAGNSLFARLDGDESLRNRPMERIADPLRKMGATINTREGKPPLEISGGNLQGIRYRPEVASAQVKSCLLLAGLHAEGETEVFEPGPSRDHTEKTLEAMGYPIEVQGRSVSVSGPRKLDPIDLEVPGDLSSASFFIAAALGMDEGRLKLPGVGINETRTGFLDLVEKMGADISTENEEYRGREPAADLIVRPSELVGIEVDGEEVVRAIDELPLLAVLATQAEGRTSVRGAEELRVKETDRISATAENLTAMGAEVRERRDGLEIQGPCKLEGSEELKSFGDHRIAMAFSVCALFAEGASQIKGAEWVATSYPGFFEDLRGLIEE